MGDCLGNMERQFACYFTQHIEYMLSLAFVTNINQDGMQHVFGEKER
jgi:hypothetical protein